MNTLVSTCVSVRRHVATVAVRYRPSWPKVRRGLLLVPAAVILPFVAIRYACIAAYAAWVRRWVRGVERQLSRDIREQLNALSTFDHRLEKLHDDTGDYAEKLQAVYDGM